MVEEKVMEEKIAAGPEFKPKRANKVTLAATRQTIKRELSCPLSLQDYQEFFERNKLNSGYAGYHVAPGTQFFKVENLDAQCNGSNNSNA